VTQRQEHITEHRVAGRRLGRHVYHDERSKDYPAEQAKAIKDVDHASHGLPLNQGDVGSCTAEALCGALNTAPDAAALKGQMAGHTFTQDDAYNLYRKETANEGHPWPGEDPGGTGLWVCKAAKQLGWITSYRHAFGLEHALAALVLRPNIWGMNWYSGMDSPDPETGIVTVNGTIRGGHEVVATQIRLNEQLVGFWQSWGSWGLNGTGRFYIGFGDLERLLSEQGDVTVPLP
jgi:hypothetical protein